MERLVADKFQVVVTTHKTVKPSLPVGVDVRPVDLSQPDQVKALVDDLSPSVIVHLAAVVPPRCYTDRTLLVRSTSSHRRPGACRDGTAIAPSFVHASTGAVHGIRNPHRVTNPVTPDSPLAPVDLYGCHKALAENIVRSSGLEWSILRLCSVIAIDQLTHFRNTDAFYFRALVPEDTRVHTVDPRDLAAAFAAAITTDAVREVFMIGGDDTHKRVWGELARENAEVMGLAAAMFPGQPGNPDNDADWYPLGWSTPPAHTSPVFQRHSSAAAYAEIRAWVGWKSRPLRIAAPALRVLMRRQAPYFEAPGRYADPWGAIRKKWGDPAPDALTV